MYSHQYVTDTLSSYYHVSTFLCSLMRSSKSNEFLLIFFSKSEIESAIQLLLKLKVEYKQVSGQDYKAGCPPPENLVLPDNGPSAEGATDEDEVNPWSVSTTNAKGVDYDKLIGECSRTSLHARLSLRTFDIITLSFF